MRAQFQAERNNKGCYKVIADSDWDKRPKDEVLGRSVPQRRRAKIIAPCGIEGLHLAHVLHGTVKPTNSKTTSTCQVQEQSQNYEDMVEILTMDNVGAAAVSCRSD